MSFLDSESHYPGIMINMHAEGDRRERTTVYAFNQESGATDLVASAERLPNHPDLAAVMVFLVTEGETWLVAHAVVPGPADWRPFGERQSWLQGVVDGMISSGVGRNATQLTTRIVRSVTTGDLERWTRKHISEKEGRLGIAPGSASLDEHKPRTRARERDVGLARLVARYVELHRTTNRPNEVLAEEYHVSVKRITNQLYSARERGLLTGTRRGRAGGVMTDKCRALLGSAEGD